MNNVPREEIAPDEDDNSSVDTSSESKESASSEPRIEPDSASNATDEAKGEHPPPVPIVEAPPSPVDTPDEDDNSSVDASLESKESASSEPRIEPDRASNATDEAKGEHPPPVPIVEAPPPPVVATQTISTSSEVGVETSILPGNSALMAPITPELGKVKKTPAPKRIFALGDIHGWAPGLISYLVHHNLAEIEINGYKLWSGVKGDLSFEEKMKIVFENPEELAKEANFRPPNAGLKGQPHQNSRGMNGDGHYNISARWKGENGDVFIQIGDIFDRADHSEVASEIIRQLIIDAPGCVFALVGNHEQFMLEGDEDNWYFNEARNAHVSNSPPKKTDRSQHFRFIPMDDVEPEDRASLVFKRYENSVQALFMTQGAVLAELGWWDRLELQDQILGSGWSAYEAAYAGGKKWLRSGANGALTALTICDFLFHHAEPESHRRMFENGYSLVDTMFEASLGSRAKLPVRFRCYEYAEGRIQDSPDQPLLWSRGSTAGARSGSPASEQHLVSLTDSWPGLTRIIHGHTPTVNDVEFQVVTKGKSVPVSYLADSGRTIPRKGRANKVRIHNIDEGFSPVYFEGSASAYDPCRIPEGIGIEQDSNSSVEITRGIPLNIDGKANLETDQRGLWRWQPNTTRLTENTVGISASTNLHYMMFSDDGTIGFIIASEKEKEVLAELDRSFSGLNAYRILNHFISNLIGNPTKVKIDASKIRAFKHMPKWKNFDANNPYLILNEFPVAVVTFTPVRRDQGTLTIMNNLKDKFQICMIQEKKGRSKSKKPTTSSFNLRAEPKEVVKYHLSNLSMTYFSLTKTSHEKESKVWTGHSDEVGNEPVLGYFGESKGCNPGKPQKEKSFTPPPPPKARKGKSKQKGKSDSIRGHKSSNSSFSSRPAGDIAAPLSRPTGDIAAPISSKSDIGGLSRSVNVKVDLKSTSGDSKPPPSVLQEKDIDLSKGEGQDITKQEGKDVAIKTQVYPEAQDDIGDDSRKSKNTDIAEFQQGGGELPLVDSGPVLGEGLGTDLNHSSPSSSTPQNQKENGNEFVLQIKEKKTEEKISVHGIKGDAYEIDFKLEYESVELGRWIASINIMFPTMPILQGRRRNIRGAASFSKILDDGKVMEMNNGFEFDAEKWIFSPTNANQQNLGLCHMVEFDESWPRFLQEKYNVNDLIKSITNKVVDKIILAFNVHSDIGG